MDSLGARVQAAYRQLRTLGIEPTPAELRAVPAPPSPPDKPKPEPVVRMLVVLFDEYCTAWRWQREGCASIPGRR